MGFAEPVIGRRFAPTRWLNPSYDVYEISFSRKHAPAHASACHRRFGPVAMREEKSE
jgi:hypothetical protein